MNVVIGVADCQVTDNSSAVLISYALGSCIGVSIYDPVVRVGGLLHFMLPEASSHSANSRKSPYMFADTGIPMMFHEAYSKGAQKWRLRIGVMGGAQIMDEHGFFNIGQKNCAAVERIFRNADLKVHAQETGGNRARTIRFELASGRIFLRSPEDFEERELAGFASAQSGRLS